MADRVALARAGERHAQIAAQRLEKVLAAQVAQSYFRVQFARHQLDHLAAVLGLLDRFEEMATARFQAAAVSYLDILRLKVERAKVANDQIDSESNLQKNLSELGRLLAGGDVSRYRLTDNLDYHPLNRDLPGVLGERLAAHGRLQQARLEVETAARQWRLARKSPLPDFSLGLFSQLLNAQPPFDANGFLGVSGRHAWGVELGISLPFFLGQGPRGRVLEARTRSAIAAIDMQLAESEVRTAIENGYRAVKATEAQVLLFERTLLPESENALQAGISLYRAAKIDSLNLLDILRTHAETRSEYYRALYHYREAVTALDAAGETPDNPGESDEE